MSRAGIDTHELFRLLPAWTLIISVGGRSFSIAGLIHACVA